MAFIPPNNSVPSSCFYCFNKLEFLPSIPIRFVGPLGADIYGAGLVKYLELRQRPSLLVEIMWIIIPQGHHSILFLFRPNSGYFFSVGTFFSVELCKCCWNLISRKKGFAKKYGSAKEINQDFFRALYSEETCAKNVHVKLLSDSSLLFFLFFLFLCFFS